MITRGRVSPLRMCDKCGAQRQANQMRPISGRWVCNWHQYYVAPETLNRLPVKTFRIKPFKDARPFTARDTYEKAEWILLEHLADNYRADSLVYAPLVAGHQVNDAFAFASITGGSSGALGAGWTAVYLYELIAEGRRPLKMINRAKVVLKEIADWLLTRIRAYPGALNGLTSADHAWGAFLQDGTTSGTASINTHHTAAAGLGLLRAYQVLGTAAYLDAARAVVWFCRNTQCGGYLASGFSSTDAAGANRFQFGTFTHRTSAAGAFDHRYEPADLTAMELYQAFLEEVGDETIGSSDTAGVYSMTRATTLSAAIAEARAFWLNGCFDATRGVVTNGFSSATPFDAFNAFPSSKSFIAGTGSWRYSDAEAATGTTIDGVSWALGLRALRAVDGDSDAVTGLFDWLMTFTSNPLSELAATASERTKYLGPFGTFDPTTGLPHSLLVRSGSPLADVMMNNGSVSVGASYHLGATGAVAGLFSLRQLASFGALKDAMNEPRPRTRQGMEDGSYHYLTTMGRCGLSFQPRTATGGNPRCDIYAAALAGLIYREEPKAFGGVGRA